GRRLGLTAMSDVAKSLDAFTAARTSAGAGAPIIAPQERSYHNETVEFTIPPRDFMEYKYRLDKGEALLYSWSASTSVNYEFHAEPDGAPRGYAETYEKKPTTAHAAGTLTAPFSGIHGWYWENKGDQELKIVLSAAGFYNISHEFRRGKQPITKVF